MSIPHVCRSQHHALRRKRRTKWMRGNWFGLSSGMHWCRIGGASARVVEIGNGQLLQRFEGLVWVSLRLEAEVNYTLKLWFFFFFMSESLNLVIRRWVKEDLVSRCNLELHDRLISIIWSTEFKETHFGACKKKQKKDWSLAVWIAMTCLSSSAKAGGLNFSGRNISCCYVTYAPSFVQMLMYFQRKLIIGLDLRYILLHQKDNH